MATDPPVQVLIADDHAIFRAALRTLLESEPGMRVVGETADGAGAVALTGRLQPDVLLLDLAMPGLTGLDVLRELRRSTSLCRTILLTAHIEQGQIVEALRIGARGIIMKESSAELLFQGIRAVVAGEHWVGRKRVADLTEFRGGSTPRRADRKRKTFGLSSRELQVVGAVVAGNSNRNIAQRLAISEDTTKHHLSNIFDKLGVSNRLELALFAYHHQIVDHVFDVVGTSCRSKRRPRTTARRPIDNN
jgi:DNA-binding NarL/FixJ family response regulator